MTYIDSFVGRIGIVENGRAIVSVFFDEPDFFAVVERGTSPLLETAASELDLYFSGKEVSFSVPLELEGTPFQKSVWEALRAIPRGETRTYGEIARTVGKSGAFRAVGQAIHRNPAAIIVPCHRVIGKDGGLTGYAGGLERKRALLKLEGIKLFMIPEGAL